VEGGRSREEVVLDLITTLSDTIPKPFDMLSIKAKYGEGEKAPLTIVLLQEMERYNTLLLHIHESMADLVKGIKGLALISPDLERMFSSLYHSTVPHTWGLHYPSLKPLGSWSRDLSLRIQQLRRWHEEELPKVFWMGGLISPVGFLTALLQQSARRSGVSIEGLSWEWVVMTTAEQAVVSRPRDGCYVKGLYMEGARWDVENGCIGEAGTMELYSAMPLVHFKPVEGRKKGSKGMHAVPMYQYPVRKAWQGQETMLGEVELKSGGKDSSFWTKRGVALLLSLEE
jgi:dynein heavy chain